MSPAFSLHLDALRATAAIVVVLSHFAYPRFTDGRYLWFRELNFGSDAVVIFFVLSGFVIAYCAAQKDRTLGAFGFSRLSRLMSVALPALILGYIFDRIGAVNFSDFYDGPYYNPIGLTEQLLRGLSFSNEWGGQELRLGTNGPYWSLSYEVAYYAMFAIFFYINGPSKWVLLAAMLLLFGLNVALLLPCWMLGVWLYHRTKAPIRPPHATARLFAILPVFLYAIALFFDVPDIMQPISKSLVGDHHLRFSNEFLWNWIVAVLTGIHLLGMHALCEDKTVVSSLSTRAVRYVAASSFSIYVFHYPVLQLTKPALFAGPATGVTDVSLLTVTMVVCLVFAALFERTLHIQRTFLRGLHMSRAQDT